MTIEEYKKRDNNLREELRLRLQDSGYSQSFINEALVKPIALYLILAEYKVKANDLAAECMPELFTR